MASQGSTSFHSSEDRSTFNDYDSPTDDLRIFVEEGRTFFCSELIAKAYKVLGIIEDDEKACCNYFPSSFSAKKCDLKFINGRYLEPELNIIVQARPKFDTEMLRGVGSRSEAVTPSS